MDEIEITLNHTIFPSKDKVSSAKFCEKLFGFEYIKEWGPFVVVKVNESLTFDLMNEEKFIPLHYAFKVTEEQFNEILGCIKSECLEYGSGPYVLDYVHMPNQLLTRRCRLAPQLSLALTVNNTKLRDQ